MIILLSLLFLYELFGIYLIAVAYIYKLNPTASDIIWSLTMGPCIYVWAICYLICIKFLKQS
jgi:hypothetical protein